MIVVTSLIFQRKHGCCQMLAFPVPGRRVSKSIFFELLHHKLPAIYDLPKCILFFIHILVVKSNGAARSNTRVGDADEPIEHASVNKRNDRSFSHISYYIFLYLNRILYYIINVNKRINHYRPTTFD